MEEKKKKRLQEAATGLRADIIEMLCLAGSGHPGGALSMSDVFAYLYFGDILNIDPENPKKKDRDRLVLSKGHVCPVLYAALARKGYFDRTHLNTLRKFGSILQGHPDMHKTPGVDISTGSLGQGLSCAVGMALGAKLDRQSLKVFAVLGDGECNEGQVWEAAMSAAHYSLDNLIAIVDKNGLQIDGYTKDIMNSEPMADKWKAFGWEVYGIDGHDFDQIDDAVQKAIKFNRGPAAIIADTVKGKGVGFMEGVCNWHGQAPSEQEKEQALQCLKGSKTE